MLNQKIRRNCKVFVFFTFSTYIFVVLCVELYLVGFLKTFDNNLKLNNSIIKVQERADISETQNDKMDELQKIFDEDYDHFDDIINLNDSISGEIIESDLGEKKDWHDYNFIEYEANRTGPGEQGKAFELTDKDREENDALLVKYGFYPLVSNKISVNRSVPDVRDAMCRDIQYLSDLPTVSVIVIFRNELASVLKRTVHSIINRTPSELLHEIILVNDLSDREEYPELYEPFQKYSDENFPNKVKIINLTERKGLIVTRIEGARTATGEVLVFFDSHMEMNVNWLPPLLGNLLFIVY